MSREEEGGKERWWTRERSCDPNLTLQHLAVGRGETPKPYQRRAASDTCLHKRRVL